MVCLGNEQEIYFTLYSLYFTLYSLSIETFCWICFFPCFSVSVYITLSSVQLLSCVQLFVITWTAVCQASLSITNSQSLLKLMFIKLVMPFNHLILCHPFLPPSILPSSGVFSSDSVFHVRWPKYCSFSFNISPSNEYSGLISFRINWFDLLAVQGTLRSLLEHHNSKPSILQCTTFFFFFFLIYNIVLVLP